MSQDITPEWLRLKRELTALLKGAWDEIGKLTDDLIALERRVEALERDIESSGRIPFHRLEIHPRQDLDKL